MKITLYSILFLLIPVLSFGQITDDSLRTYTDTYIIPNNARAITGAQANTIFNDIIDSKENIDSAFRVMSVDGNTYYVTYNEILDTLVFTGVWTQAGNYVYLENDSVGIGTSTPSTKLEVVGNVEISGKLVVVNIFIYCSTI